MKNYFTKLEIALWTSSVISILVSFFIFDNGGYLNLVASLIGVTSLIFCAKGNPAGQFLMIIFSTLYAVISFSFSYYGEMVTYLLMTLPMSVFAFISWIKNPFKGNRSQVEVGEMKKKDYIIMTVSALAVTVIFYFVLRYFGTANLIPSTFSVTTSFIAVYLSYKRSPFYALAYASNDIVLIVLWTLASLYNKAYISVTVCFIAFLVNDIYGFINWRKTEKNQKIAL